MITLSESCFKNYVHLRCSIRKDHEKRKPPQWEREKAIKHNLLRVTKSEQLVWVSNLKSEGLFLDSPERETHQFWKHSMVRGIWLSTGETTNQRRHVMSYDDDIDTIIEQIGRPYMETVILARMSMDVLKVLYKQDQNLNSPWNGIDIWDIIALDMDRMLEIKNMRKMSMALAVTLVKRCARQMIEREMK